MRVSESEADFIENFKDGSAGISPMHLPIITMYIEKIYRFNSAPY